MKYLVYIIASAFLSLSATRGMAGHRDMVEKKKTLTETYTVSSSDKIAVTNSFGQVKLNTWNRKEVKVEITIIGRSASEKKAQDILDKIIIEHGKNSAGVYFKTIIDKISTNGNKQQKKEKNYKSEGMEINYVVYLPAQNPIDISNSFGALELGDFDGEAVLESKFGSLVAGQLTNVKKLQVEFGRADIKAINNGKLVIKFSKANIGRLSGNIQSNVEFCETVETSIDKTLKQFNLKSSYSTISIALEKDLSADFDIKTSFGEVDNSSTFDIPEKKQQRKGPVFDKMYYGTAGRGAAKVMITSEFGNIRFQ